MKKDIRIILKKLRLYPHYLIFRYRFFPNQFQKEEIERIPQRMKFYSQFINEGKICFDVGANIGNRVEIFLKLKASVVAVEPQQFCCDYLKARYGNKIELVQKALGSSNTREMLYYTFEGSGVASLATDWVRKVKERRFSDHTWHQKKEVHLTTLDDLIDQYGTPQFCKIDVEGYEMEVLKGLSKKMKFLSFEITLPECQDIAINCIRHLASIGEIRCNYSLFEDMELALQLWISMDQMINTINDLSKEEKFIAGDIYVKFL